MKNQTELNEIDRRALQNEALRVIGENAVEIAHELKAPLTGIYAHLQMLERRLKTGKAVSEDLRFSLVYSEIKRMSCLLSQVTCLASPAAGRSDGIELGALCTEIGELLKALTICHRITLELDLPSAPLFVDIAENQLRRLLVNLVVNAVQALRGYRDDGRITVSLRADGSDIVLSVRDNGPGMDGETLEKIFDPYFTTKEEGTGLGLPLCARIVRENSGTFTVFSEKEKGAAFVLRFPRSAATVAKDPQSVNCKKMAKPKQEEQEAIPAIVAVSADSTPVSL